MKNLIVYYSLSGNTAVVAKEIADATGGDLVKIEEVRQRNPLSFGAAAFSALFGLKSKLMPMQLSLDEYDNIFIGGQVWAGKSAPAINTFLDKTDFLGKNVYLFLTQADGKMPDTVFSSIVKRVQNKHGRVIDRFFIQTKMKSVIMPQDVRQPVANWVSKLNLTK